MERDLYSVLSLLKIEYFNSHAHVERDLFQNCAAIISVNFNSHAHVERDDSVIALIPVITISTHTLTWSVTVKCIAFISQNPYFNSHAHVERDPL